MLLTNKNADYSTQSAGTALVPAHFAHRLSIERSTQRSLDGRYLDHDNVRKIYTAPGPLAGVARQLSVFKAINAAGAQFALVLNYPWRTEARPGVLLADLAANLWRAL